MTKNVTDTKKQFCEENDVQMGFIPSRRQIDYLGGYVNSWNTPSFCKYVRGKTDRIKIIRDHGGPCQGQEVDNGIASFAVDSAYFDGIHIDVWKKHQEMEDAIQSTAHHINRCYDINPNLFFEIGTEEAIRKYEAEELEYFIRHTRDILGNRFDQVHYAVVQCGTSLKNTINTGRYASGRLSDMVSICKKYNIKSKEHNGDYVSQMDKNEKFGTGLDCINIAPEFGVLETEVILNKLNLEEFEIMFKICNTSKKWVKWVNADFIPDNNKKDTIRICGHYVRNHPIVRDIVKRADLEREINSTIYNKLVELYS
jgi:hypothetical protein